MRAANVRMDGGHVSSRVNERMGPHSRQRRFEHVDGLRAFAVLLVVIMHSGLTFVPGDTGVTVFLGISGFIITYILLHERERTGGFDAKAFYIRRLFKLAPPFIIAIALPAVVYGLFRPLDIKVFLSQVFFSYNWVRIFDTNAGVMPGSEVVWSLAVEEQFYIVFSIIWLVMVRLIWWRQALIALSITGIIGSTWLRTTLAKNEETLRVLWGTDTRLDAIAWGVLASVLIFMWQRGQLQWLSAVGQNWALYAGIILLLGGMVFRDGWMSYAFRPSIQVVGGILVLLFGMVHSETRLKRCFRGVMAWGPVQAVGLASYSIYLVHDSVGIALSAALPEMPLILDMTLTSAAGIIAGLCIYQWVEIPSLKFRKKLFPA